MCSDHPKEMDQWKSNCESTTYEKTSLQETAHKIQAELNQSREKGDFL